MNKERYFLSSTVEAWPQKIQIVSLYEIICPGPIESSSSITILSHPFTVNLPGPHICLWSHSDHPARFILVPRIPTTGPTPSAARASPSPQPIYSRFFPGFHFRLFPAQFGFNEKNDYLSSDDGKRAEEREEEDRML
ncbi:hypothetical protein GWI33_014970 [Rhynchophorus ferrugineus]|uniref:Uncharacterized protein n=1 Tax=Rhynchophorus ferrugineus TaxID=354439 RepID=A0A834MBV2_RHYFE|nr:hypothetical protein GWI33_014970 [Rhynchophorus ferrugineus]